MVIFNTFFENLGLDYIADSPYFFATEACVLQLPLCYQSQRDCAGHRSGSSAFVWVRCAGTQGEGQLWSPQVPSLG